MEPYTQGMNILDRHRNQIFCLQASDKFFMAKFVNLVDCVFNNFCRKLASYNNASHPIREARKHLCGMVQNHLDRRTEDLEYGYMPNLPLPDCLHLNHQINPIALPDPPRPEVARTPSDSQPIWWTTNPSPVHQWLLPQGKQFTDFFHPITDLGKANTSRFPKVPHHQLDKNRTLCIKYQVRGKCQPQCWLSHIPQPTLLQKPAQLRMKPSNRPTTASPDCSPLAYITSLLHTRIPCTLRVVLLKPWTLPPTYNTIQSHLTLQAPSK